MTKLILHLNSIIKPNNINNTNNMQTYIYFFLHTHYFLIHTETSLLDLDEETVVGYVTLPPEVPVVSTLPLEIDEKITHKKNKTIYPNSYYYNIDVIIGKTCSSGAPWMAIAIAIMSFVILLVLVIIKILLKSNVLNNFTG